MERHSIREGMKVHSADGSTLGKVAACGPDTFIIEKGWFFTKEYSARYDQVSTVREDELWLRESDRELGGPSAASQGESMPPGVREEHRMPLVEEELTVEKHRHEAGEVQIHKEVITEQKQVMVPVTREEVHVERVEVSRDAQPGEAGFREATVTVPVHEEEVEIHKHPVVREEVRVTKTPREEHERHAARVRKEHAQVRTDGDLPAPSER